MNENHHQPTHKSLIIPHPKEGANWLSKTFFYWTAPIFRKGLKKELTESDIYPALKEHESTKLADKLEENWMKEKKTRSNPSLAKALWRNHVFIIMMQGFVVFIDEFICKLSQPLCLGKLMQYYEPNQTSISKPMAYFYASCIVITSLVHVVLDHGYVMRNLHTGMKMRVACCALIYRKSLKLNQQSLMKTTLGQIINLLSNDVNRFDIFMFTLHMIWMAPLQIVVITYILYSILGIYSLIGILIFILYIPIQALRTDERIRLMNEIISGVQVIKMYTWEKPFTKLVEIARQHEIKQIQHSSYIPAVQLAFKIFMNRTAIFISILFYVLMGNHLTAYYVFVITAFYNVLQKSITSHLPTSIKAFAEVQVSIERLTKFLLLDEISEPEEPKKHSKDVGVSIKEASAKWMNTSKENTLDHVDFHVASGQLVAIVGSVGSGKSSLLNVILKELPLVSGSVTIDGTVSYASQEPWLFSGSIRQNILFGQKMNLEKYQQVVRVCALNPDFALFPYGDKTLIGEKGVMLSGGQKTRINLARTVYKDADIYLLDDPFSAVDTQVGKQLFDQCISTYLRDKCVILVTHQLQFLREAHKIFLIDRGQIVLNGTYKQIQDSGTNFSQYLDHGDDKEETKDVLEENSTEFKRFISVEEPEEVLEQKKLGDVNKKIYGEYIKAGGRLGGVLIIFAYILTQTVATSSDYFITFWVNNLEHNKSSQVVNNLTKHIFDYSLWTTENYVYIYTTLIFLIIVISLLSYMSFVLFCMKASRYLHNNMFINIVNTTMRFFNTNPSGRILNRFSKDMGSIDETLPRVISDAMETFITTAFIVLVVISINFWILIPTIIIMILFYLVRMIFLASSRSIKRMESTTKSPVYSHITATVQGLTTIRAFGAEALLKKEFDVHQNLNTSTFYMYLGINRAFGFILDLFCVIFSGFVTLSFLFIDIETYGGSVGLAITQSLYLTGMIQWGVRQWSEMENQMTSVERVVEYSQLEREEDVKPRKELNNWPNVGQIKFDLVSLKYSEFDHYVLHNLSFTIKSKEKIGIVGRTGAGKSSLITALFRLTQVEGKIIIDDIDTKTISLQQLRSKISIIPQEPVLFSGTLRKNLDPFEEYKDEDLWNALEQVELKYTIQDMPGALDTRISEGGSNFSVGQKQLVCLARAIIRKNKILLLDEATANVDPQTDSLIQTTIRSKFESCTVLTIAHRLPTIMDSDRILVLDKGNVVEFDEPFKLLQNKNGALYNLVQQTGNNMSEQLLNLAHKSNTNKRRF